MHVIDSLDRGGAERMLVEIANRASADGCSVAVCVTRSGEALAGSLSPEIALKVLHRKQRFDVPATLAFLRWVRQTQPQVAHVHGFSTLSYVALLKALRALRIPVVMHDHEGRSIHSGCPRWFRHVGRKCVSQYVAVSKHLAEWAFNAGVARNRVSVIENALDLSPYRSAEPLDLRREFGLPTGVLVGVAVGNLRAEKGFDTLLDSVARSSCRERFVTLIVGGDLDPAYAARLREQRERLGLRDRVVFTGPRTDVPQLLKAADFAVLPSRCESGPLALIEHLATGLPFVATRVGWISEIVASLNVPEFVPGDDPAALGAALDRLVSMSPAERRERGLRGAAIAAERFEIGAVMPRWYQVYRSAIQEGV